jgi:hypothetical protein
VPRETDESVGNHDEQNVSNWNCRGGVAGGQGVE